MAIAAPRLARLSGCAWLPWLPRFGRNCVTGRKLNRGALAEVEEGVPGVPGIA